MYNKIWMKIYNLQIQVYAEFVYVQMYVVFIIFCSLQVELIMWLTKLIESGMKATFSLINEKRALLSSI